MDSLATKYNEITDYIKLSLGDRMIDVELDKEHYDMAIKQALLRYRQRASNSQEEGYCFLDLTKETQDYTLPAEIQMVRTVYRRGVGSVTGTSASQFEPFASGFLNTYMLSAGRLGGLLSFELFTGYQELTMKMFGGHMLFQFNNATKKLFLPRKVPGDGETVLLHVYMYKPDIALLSDYMIFPWLQDYAKAQAKLYLGEARERFATIAGPQGGTALNGAAIKAEAKADQDALIEQLKQYVDGSNPVSFIIG